MAVTEINIVFAKNMQKRRQTRHITQEKLGQMCGLHRTYIGGIEQFIRNPSLKSMEKIAKALDTSVSLLTNTHYEEIINSEYTVAHIDNGKFSFHHISVDCIEPKYLDVLDKICHDAI